ncbi:hypothetical protein BU23DRAFT_663887 [Bimuria novae-zelandiae CBS 107.79]|uniref:Uncharacterized protein n=1 Tax=Bimuria novae-zelandiae CBS 107.79 TaxID=1447943 RepID=A0A6A5UN12_9PLEO|nr:hypothetical protein BU23DRAFT_663887 [Bimuria novae-zelandiae CBS 107.79]
MAQNYINPRNYDSNQVSKDGVHYFWAGNDPTDNREASKSFSLPSLPLEGSPPSYGPSSTMKDFSHVQFTSTDAREKQISPPQTRITPNVQQWTSTDHHVKRLLPKGSFAHVPGPMLTLPTQPSPSQRLAQTPAFNQSPIPQGTYIQHSNQPLSSGYEATVPWQDTPSPRVDYHPPQTSFQQPHNSIRTDRWQQAREYRRKVYEPPYIDPNTDDTIAHVEANAEAWVDQLIRAMANTKDVKDTATSHHRRLFSSDAIDSLLVEACCREIFSALIDRCTNGFRGPAQFNKALKASQQLEPDRTATCEERIQNVVKVLSWNKRACKDVLYEDWKIRLLVNHPLSYDKEKDSQKGSNDQRRRRQLAERVKMEKTEEELRAYREALGQGHAEDMSATQYGGSSAYETQMPAGWLHEQSDGRPGSFGTALGKRVTYDDYGTNDAKRHFLNNSSGDNDAKH